MIKRIAATLVLFVFAGTAYAGSITITPAMCGDGTGESFNCWTSDLSSAEKPSDFADYFGASADDIDLAYKDDQDVGEEGSFQDSYTTYYLPDSSEDKTSAEIRWDGAPNQPIVCSAENPCYVAVKDGNASPNTYVFEVTSWDGEGSLHLNDFFCDPAGCPDGKNISHVAIWGGGSYDVPEPGSLALFGLGLLGMGLMRRRS